MYTCCCGGLTESKIKEKIEEIIEREQKLLTIEDLQNELPVGCFCGTCKDDLYDMIDEANKNA